MKSRLYFAILVSGVGLYFPCSDGAQAATTVSIVKQNDADFTGSGPTSSFNPPWVKADSTLTDIQAGSVPNTYRSPFENYGTPGTGVGDWATLKYTSVQAGGTAVYNIPTGASGLSILWGSPDSYNTLTFYSEVDGGGSILGSFTGSNLLIQSYGHDLVTFQTMLNTPLFESIVLTSSVNAFEFADLSVTPSNGGPGGFGTTPLPAALPLFAGGLGLYGLLARRRRQQTAG